MNKKIVFIGIGNMGEPMARNLIREGFQLSVYDKNIEHAKRLLLDGAKIATNLIDCIEPDSIIITMLPNDEALLDIIVGQQGIASVLGCKNIHISMSTVSPETIQQINAAHQKNGTHFIAAPVLGRPIAAATKKLWVFLAGESETKQSVLIILNAFSQGIYDFGNSITAANIIKLAINFLILSAIEAMGEAFAFVEKSGLDKKLFAEMVCETLFSCPAYQYHATNIATQTFSPPGFRMALGMKDINLLLKAAGDGMIPMPLANLLHDRLISALAKKRDEMDWSAITLNSAEDAGLIA